MTVNQMIEDFESIFCPDFMDADNAVYYASLLGIFALGYNAAQKPNVSKPHIKKVEDSGIKPENIYDTFGMIEPEVKQGSEDE